MKRLLLPPRKNRMQYLLLLVFCFPITGCVAALGAMSLASLGMAGFSGYKVVQLETGGEAEVRFVKSELSAEDKEVLSSLKHLAIYPVPQREQEAAMLADVLSKSGQYEIIPPFTVKKTFSKTGWPPNFKGMTKQEQIKYACQLCNTLKAEGIFVLTHGDTKIEARHFSFKKAEWASSFQIDLFSVKYKRVIWAQKGDMAVSLGSKTPAQEEIDKILATAIAEKFLEDSGKGKGIETPKESQISVPPQPTPPPAPEERKPEPAPAVVYLITIKNSNIRTEPTAKSQIITTIKKGTKLEKIGESPDWFKVRLPSGETGHIYRPLVIVIP